MKIALLLLVTTVGLTGCAVNNPGCVGQATLTVSPMWATIDHDAAPPGNQQKFTVTEGETFSSPAGICAVPAVLAVVHPTWTNPDPLNVSISSSNDETNGTAVCTGATSGPVTLTGTVATTAGQTGATGQLSVTTQLTCK